MNLKRAFYAGLCLWTCRAAAVYAPIPELEKGKAITVYAGAGVQYDSNIFGAATDEVDSIVYQFAPSLAFNASVAPRTFASAAYRLSLDYVADRPGSKALDSHEFAGRVAHTFSPLTELDLSDTFQLSKNPESLLPGIGTVLSTDQSYRRNQFDLRFAHGLTKRTGITTKVRHSFYAYDNAALASELDRSEYLLGLAASHAVLPEILASAEYRFQDIDYDTDGSGRDKRSHFLLAGCDYVLNKRTGLSARAGVERRNRKQERTSTSPFIELAAKYDFGRESYVAAGYAHATEETSNVDLYVDRAVNRFFVNLQQTLTPKSLASASVTWEPGVLRGRRGVSPDRDETNFKAGVAFQYKPAVNWSVSATLDYDRIRSDDPNRGLSRMRSGVSAKFVF